jgi:hypothetical protein
MNNMNPVLTGSFALLSGDLVGTLLDRVMRTFDERMKSVSVVSSLGNGLGNLVDTSLGIFLHVGIISLSSELLARSVPWMFSEPAGYTLYLLALSTTSPHLFEHLKKFNDILLGAEAFTSRPKEGDLKTPKME